MESRQLHRMVRKMGLIRDQEGIMTRYLRERQGWDAHLEKCRRFIHGSFKNLPDAPNSIDSVNILGSGWLLDVPLEWLSKHFKRVILTDLFHPPQIRKKVEHFSNVELCVSDLSGSMLKWCWEHRKDSHHQLIAALDSLSLEIPDLPESDAAISLNLLSQLPMLPIEYFQKRGITIPEEQRASLSQLIQQFHLGWMSENPGCLITDIQENHIETRCGSASGILNKNRSDAPETLIRPLLFTRLPEGIRSDKWEWKFDHSGRYRKGMQTTMQVAAVEWRSS